MNPEKKPTFDSYDNIVSLRNTLPPLQQDQPEISVQPVLEKSSTQQTPTGIILLSTVIFVFLAAIVIVGYQRFFALNNSQADKFLRLDVVAPEVPAQTINPPTTPARDATYTINTPPAPAETTSSLASAEITPAESMPLADPAALQSQPLPQDQPHIKPVRTATHVSATSEANLSLENKARIDAIEGYIIEMLTVLDTQKKELQEIKDVLAKNAADIQTNTRRVAELTKQRQSVQSPAKTNSLSTTFTSLPFRATSLRQIGEAVTVRVESTTGKTLLVIGQLYLGWQLTGVNTDTRDAEFLHLSSQSRIKVTL